MSQVKTEAIVLRSRNYRDKSKIVSLYTKSHGKMTFIAKGVRDTKSRWGGVLQSMAYLNVMFYYNENRTLHLLSGADFERSFQSIFGEYEKTQSAYRIVELLNLATEENHESAELFELIVETLCNLEIATKNYVNLFFNFELRLAKILGFAINPDEFCGITGEDKLRLVGNLSQGQNMPSDASKTMNLLLSGSFDDFRDIKISPPAEKSIDNFLEFYFRTHIDNMNFMKANKVMKSKEIIL